MRLDVIRGPWLLSAADPGLATHRAQYGATPVLTLHDLVDLAERSRVLGRGGAGFPFATKLRATTQAKALRRHVVVNLSEGEPASAKDAALVTTAPHLVLDGAALTAAALAVRTVHVVVPSEAAWVERAVTVALAERKAAREDKRIRWVLHRAEPRFVSGEASAVTELIDGRRNLPVTSWVPTAVKGVNGQPTLLSNAETYAQVAALAHGGQVPGPVAEPGTRLLSVTRGTRIEVHEVAHGTPWESVLTPAELSAPVLLGGYHGQWLRPHALTGATVSASSMKDLGVGLGAGVVLPLAEGTCGLEQTALIVRYLANQSAGRCGPCVRGLPALATAFEALVDGRSHTDVAVAADLVRGRGACAHPDGTARLAVSAAETFAAEVDLHVAGRCSSRAAARAWSA